MIVYPLTMPAAPLAPKSIQLAQNFIVAGSDSPFTGQQQIYEHQGSWWSAKVDLPFLTRAQAAPWLAMLAALNGKSGTFLLGDPMATGPIGSAGGNPVVNGAGQSGKTLNISGLTGVLKAGDFFHIGSAGENLILQSQALATSPWGVLGSAPPVPPVPTNNAAVAPDGTTTATSIAFAATTGSQFGDVNQALSGFRVDLQTFTFSVYLKVASGTASITVLMQDNPFTTLIASQNVTVTTAWQRFTITGTASGAVNPGIYIAIRQTGTLGAQTVLAWGGQFEHGATANNYIPTLAASIGPTRRLYMNLTDTSGGSPTLDIFPRLRTVASNPNAAPLAGEALILANPRGLFRLASNQQPYTIDKDGHYSISFDAREAF